MLLLCTYVHVYVRTLHMYTYKTMYICCKCTVYTSMKGYCPKWKSTVVHIQAGKSWNYVLHKVTLNLSVALLCFADYVLMTAMGSIVHRVHHLCLYAFWCHLCDYLIVFPLSPLPISWKGIYKVTKGLVILVIIHLWSCTIIVSFYDLAPSLSASLMSQQPVITYVQRLPQTWCFQQHTRRWNASGC